MGAPPILGSECSLCLVVWGDVISVSPLIRSRLQWLHDCPRLAPRTRLVGAVGKGGVSLAAHTHICCGCSLLYFVLHSIRYPIQHPQPASTLIIHKLISSQSGGNLASHTYLAQDLISDPWMGSPDGKHYRSRPVGPWRFIIHPSGHAFVHARPTSSRSIHDVPDANTVYYLCRVFPAPEPHNSVGVLPLTHSPTRC